MQRLALVVAMLAAACGGGGTDTGPATLTGVDVKASSTEPFSGADAQGNTVLGWTILLYEDDAGGDCKSGTVLAKVSIYTNQADGSAEQAILQTGGISIVPDKPPTIVSNAAANMSAEGVGNISGIISIDEFHLTADAMHADRISGSIAAGGYDASEAAVSLNGTFMAPICED